MADKLLVDRIVAAKGFEEKDRAWLDALEDAQLTKFNALCAEPATVTSSAATAAEPEKVKEPVKAEPVVTETETVKTKTETVKTKTEEEILAELPEERREMFAEMQARWDGENAKLTKDIVANSKGLFSEDDLKGKSRKELEKLATGWKPEPEFTGRALQAHDATSGNKTKHAPMPTIKIGAGA